MIKKLIAGDLSLSDTFWKFGVLGMALVIFVVRLFGSFLAGKLKGISLYTYYSKYFNPLNMDTGIVANTCLYLGSLVILCWLLGTYSPRYSEYVRSLVLHSFTWHRFKPYQINYQQL